MMKASQEMGSSCSISLLDAQRAAAIYFLGNAGNMPKAV